ncbi:sporulation integral membrane protein YtvI [Paenibacillus chartarius]|uniref:Sporulation integral membrane protein YtvI n=1 Tax=Paenibacillus chartarius TaxID=747481 RepID=A0ABV6DI90_9BACL
MILFWRKYWRTAFDIAILLFTVYIFMLLFSYLYRIATPIFLAFVIYLIIEPFARFMNRRGIKKSIASAISTLIFVLVILSALTGAGVLMVSQTIAISAKFGDYTILLQEQIALRAEEINERYQALPEEVVNNIKEYAGRLVAYLTTIAKNFLTTLVGLLTSVSTFVVNFVIGIILAYFLSIEIDTWKRLAEERTPSTFKAVFQFLRENVIKGIVTYLKAQLKLISITFFLIFIGLLVLGVSNAFTLAVLSAIFDILPLLGVPVLFIPWILYLLIVGNTKLAIALTVLLVITMVVRQISEPKITGDSLGVSAFTMLSFIIISLSLFGVAGLFLAPILIITIKALLDQGHLQRWIRLPVGEYEQK